MIRTGVWSANAKKPKCKSEGGVNPPFLLPTDRRSEIRIWENVKIVRMCERDPIENFFLAIEFSNPSQKKLQKSV